MEGIGGGFVFGRGVAVRGWGGVLLWRALADLAFAQVEAVFAEEFAQAWESVFQRLADVGFSAGEMGVELVAVEFQAHFERPHILRGQLQMGVADVALDQPLDVRAEGVWEIVSVEVGRGEGRGCCGGGRMLDRRSEDGDVRGRLGVDWNGEGDRR